MMCLTVSHTTLYGCEPCFSTLFWVTLWQADVWVNRLQAARTVGEQHIPCIRLQICRDDIRRKSAHGRRYPCDSLDYYIHVGDRRGVTYESVTDL